MLNVESELKEKLSQQPKAITRAISKRKKHEKTKPTGHHEVQQTNEPTDKMKQMKRLEHITSMVVSHTCVPNDWCGSPRGCKVDGKQAQ